MEKDKMEKDKTIPKVQKQCGDQLWLNATLVARALGFEDLAVQAVDFAGEERAFLAVLRP